MQINVITLFPDMIEEALKPGVVGSALERHSVNIVNPRTFTSDVHGTVDDRPFGGGDGMIMKIEPLIASLESLGEARGRVVYLSPQGKLWNDDRAREWAKSVPAFTLVCGRYGGVDERFITQYVDEEISIGDYVLSGGELAALVMIDSILRLTEGALGNEDSAANDTFVNGLLEAPQFTRPREHSTGQVPEFLLSGDHKRIAELRQALAIVRTAQRRPDLWSKAADECRLGDSISRLLDLSDQELKSLGLGRSELQAMENMR